MAIKKPAKSKPKEKAEPRKNGTSTIRRLLFCLFLLLLLAVSGGLVYLICLIPRELIFENQRFKLRQVEVRNSEYWRDKKNELLNRAKLSFGTNIFSIDVAAARKNVSAIGNVNRVEIKLILPDKIIFELQERTALARVGDDRVVDSAGVVFNAAELSSSADNLPQITGDVDNTTMLKRSLQLIDTVNGDCHWIKLKTIRIHASHLDVSVIHSDPRYQQDKNLTVLFPPDGDLKDLLRKLVTAILNPPEKEYSTIDLSVPGSAIFR